jgi:hypothetical protein
MAMLPFQFLNVFEPRRGLLGYARRLRYLRRVYIQPAVFGYEDPPTEVGTLNALILWL